MNTKLRLLPALLLVACGGEPPTVPDAPPPTAQCGPLEPAAPGKNLARLRPGAEEADKALSLPALLKRPTPPSEAQWRALPAEADEALVERVSDETAPVATRARAMAGLAVRGSAAGEAPLKAVLAKPGDATLRRSALRALAEGYLGSALPAVLEVLKEPDALMREAAVKALAGHLDHPGVKEALTAHRETEGDELVQEALAEALR